MNFHEYMRRGHHRDHRTRQATNPIRAKRRASIKAAGGIRQFKKLMRKGRAA